MNRTRALSLVGSLLLAAPLAFAQNPGGGPPPMFGQSDGGRPMDRGAEGRGMGRGMMGIVPPGAWWKNPNVVTLLALTPDQQKRMDDILLQSRIQLIHMKASLEEEQLKLEPLLNTNPLDQSRALAQISKIADLRADLEKADAKMLLSLRGVLTADQWTKLQADRHKRHEGMGREGMDGMRNHRGPDGQPGQAAPPPPSAMDANPTAPPQPPPAE
jgi:Spy/CpxP family protein refolding chaperone